MALINKWPQDKEAFYDNKQWEAKNWSIGEPITKEKLQKMDDGIAILATQVKAILGEFNPSSLDGAQLNASRLDDIQTWITGSDSTTYSGTNIIARLSGIDTLNTTQNTEISNLKTRATNIENVNTTQNNRLTALENELSGNGTGISGTSRLDSIQEWITGSSKGSYVIEGSGGYIASRLATHDNEIEKIKGWIADGSGYQGDRIEDRLGSIESSIETMESSIGTAESSIETINSSIITIENRIDDNENNIESIEALITGAGGIESRINTLESDDGYLTTRIENLESSNYSIRTWITSGNDYSGIDLDSRISDLENLKTWITGGSDYSNDDSLDTRISTVESIVGNGAIGTDTDISAAIRRLSDIVAALDPTGSAEATSFLVSEVWGQSFSEDIDFTADSRIDILENTTSNLGNQITTLATEQNTLEQNLAATNAKIPIEMYIATNSSASDTLVINASPRDKSIFFIAIPQGTLGTNNLILQTNDIQFNNIIIRKIYNGEGIKIKYAPNSLISIYRNGSNAYVINVPMVL